MAARKESDVEGRRMAVLNNVMSTVDWVVKIFVDFLEQRYKIQKRIEDIKGEVSAFVLNIKRFVFRSIVEAVLLITGILALVAGVLILLSRIVPIEYVLIGYGLIILLIITFQLKTRP